MPLLPQDVHIDCARPGAEPPRDMLPAAAAIMAGGFLVVSLACGAEVPTLEHPSIVHEVATEAEEPSEEPSAGRTPAGLTEKAACAPGGLQRVNFWDGEYPHPVIDVTEAVTVPAYADPCDAKSSTKCTLEAGVYHPWSAGEAFVTLRAVQQFTASEALTVEGRAIKKGETVEIPSYMAEGYCRWRVRGEEFEAMCPDVAGLAMVEAAGSAPSEVQLLDPGCGKWVEVTGLLAHDKVRDGVILGYGSVGPADAH
ncbi:MAG: hypothetical protein KC912_10755 [Proteobacteria bacterium]|nr:hypothetical protein [Pseudomonadota bacterium]